MKKGLITGNLLFWVLSILIGEALLWRRKNSEVIWKQVYESVANGTPLVLLDNLVLNVSEFMNQHPGGRFLIRHHIGTDISKYFYGGYALEGNLGRSPAQGHNHS